MPVKVRVKGKTHLISPSAEWKSEALAGAAKEDWKVATDLFYIEIEAGRDEPASAPALAHLATLAQWTRVLGTYART